MFSKKNTTIVLIKNFLIILICLNNKISATFEKTFSNFSENRVNQKIFNLLSIVGSVGFFVSGCSKRLPLSNLVFQRTCLGVFVFSNACTQTISLFKDKQCNCSSINNLKN